MTYSNGDLALSILTATAIGTAVVAAFYAVGWLARCVMRKLFGK